MSSSIRIAVASQPIGKVLSQNNYLPERHNATPEILAKLQAEANATIDLKTELYKMVGAKHKQAIKHSLDDLATQIQNAVNQGNRLTEAATTALIKDQLVPCFEKLNGTVSKESLKNSLTAYLDGCISAAKHNTDAETKGKFLGLFTNYTSRMSAVLSEKKFVIQSLLQPSTKLVSIRSVHFANQICLAPQFTLIDDLATLKGKLVTNRCIRKVIKQKKLSSSQISQNKRGAEDFYSCVVFAKLANLKLTDNEKYLGVLKQMGYFNRLCNSSMRHLAKFHLTVAELKELGQLIGHQLGLDSGEVKQFLEATLWINFRRNRINWLKTLVLAIPSLLLAPILVPAVAIFGAIEMPYTLYSHDVVGDQANNLSGITKVILIPFHMLIGAIAGAVAGVYLPFELRADNVSGGDRLDSETRTLARLMQRLALAYSAAALKHNEFSDAIPSVAEFNRMKSAKLVYSN